MSAIEVIDLLERHFEASPEMRECFNERFPLTDDMFEIVHVPRENIKLYDLRIEPSAALKSFIQDLI